MPPSDTTARDRRESPTMVASRLGLGWRRGTGGDTVTWDRLLDLSYSAYWKRRTWRAPVGVTATGEAVVAPTGNVGRDAA